MSDRRVLGEVRGLTSTWYGQPNVVVDTWDTFDVDLPDVRHLLLEVAFPFGRDHGVTTWIADTSDTAGVLTPALQAFMAEESIHGLVAAGVFRFINIMPRRNLAKMSTRRYNGNFDPAMNIETHWVDSLHDGLALAATPIEHLRSGPPDPEPGTLEALQGQEVRG